MPRYFQSATANLSPGSTLRGNNSTVWCWTEEDIRDIFCTDCEESASDDASDGGSDGDTGGMGSIAMTVGASVGAFHGRFLRISASDMYGVLCGLLEDEAVRGKGLTVR